MGLVFFGRQTPNGSLIIQKQPKSQQIAIHRGAAQLTACGTSANNRSVKKLTPENLLFLQNIGILKNKNEPNHKREF